MENSFLRELQGKLEVLYDILREITPSRQMNEHPFGAHPGYMSQIVGFVDSIIEQARHEREALALEIRDMENKIQLYCTQLHIPVPKTTAKSVDNLSLVKELLQNEIERILLARRKIQTEIEVLREEIGRVRNCLGIAEDDGGSQEISLDVVSALKSKLNDLNAEKDCMESKRQSYYDEIEGIGRAIRKTVTFSFEEKICDLKVMAEGMRNEMNYRSNRLSDLLKEIGRRESYLGLAPREFPDSLGDENMESMVSYNEHLRSEQSRLFDEIFDRTGTELMEICKIFGIEVAEYDRSEASLDSMRILIESLIPKKEKFVEISASIQKRRALLEKMTEFEKIASDPRRLFKSSFQLNTEEKFRNSAYPSLLKMEESLFEMIDSYERQFGKFIHENQEYRSALRNEIENRIINKTVFISRCDSPYRKKR